MNSATPLLARQSCCRPHQEDNPASFDLKVVNQFLERMRLPVRHRRWSGCWRESRPYSRWRRSAPTESQFFLRCRCEHKPCSSCGLTCRLRAVNWPPEIDSRKRGDHGPTARAYESGAGRAPPAMPEQSWAAFPNGTSQTVLALQVRVAGITSTPRLSL